jgi:uncharacterized protein (DUF934 family)
MARIVRKAHISDESWLLHDPTRPVEAVAAMVSRGEVTGVLVSKDQWEMARPVLAAGSIPSALLLKNTDDPLELGEIVEQARVIAIEFPRFTDGRGYSSARLLRGRLDFRGELRAVGDIMRDQVFYLMRVGFDAFELRDDQDAAAAITAYRDFSVSYQASSDQPLPHFRRHAA